MAEIDQIVQSHWCLSRKRFAPAAFRRADHFGEPSMSMTGAVQQFVHEKTGLTLRGPIRLLTQLRHFGVYFSPINVFYCFDQSETLTAMVAEVSNTPWNERHCYVLWEGNRLKQSATRYSHPKEFHVSPFMGMDSQYQWRIQPPSESLHLSLGCDRNEDRIFQAHLHLNRVPLTSGQVLRTMLRRPISAVHMLGAIYYQAFKLWMKKCQFLSPPPSLSGEQFANGSNSRGAGGHVTAGRRSLVTAALQKSVFAKLDRIKDGAITIIDGSTNQSFGDPAADLHAVIRVHDGRFYRSIVFGGSVAAGESYRDGWWSCDNLVALIRIFARNMQTSSNLAGAWNSLIDISRKVAHRVNRNTRAGSRRNIAAHYDLSNEFYSLFLDETMTYSSGVFATPTSSLAEASIEKYDRICRKLNLRPADEILEIGTGWGGFAEHAALNYGCRVTTTTISGQQHEYARTRFRNRGIDDRVTLLQTDYRDLSGQYDKLVSIEMIEAVGHEFFDTFFRKCSSLLRPNGLFALQAITIPEQRYDQYCRSVDFIQKHIFPGGCLPSLGAMARSVGRVTDLQFAHVEDFCRHYARTLACWRDRFHSNMNQIRDLGISESFLRLWEFYFCYCEGAFREKQIGVSQLLLQKPANRADLRYPSLG